MLYSILLQHNFTTQITIPLYFGYGGSVDPRLTIINCHYFIPRSFIAYLHAVELLQFSTFMNDKSLFSIGVRNVADSR